MEFDAKALQQRLEEVLGASREAHEVTFKPMFGGVTGYTRGRNFVSLSNVGLALKLDAEQREALLKEPGARPLQYDPSMPPSKHSVTVPDVMLDDTDRLRAWVEKSITYCQTQPLPKKRAPKAKKGS